MFRISTNFESIHKLKNAVYDVDGDVSLVDEVAKTNAIKDYEGLYRKFNSLLPEIKKNMTDVWQFLCLSGETDAFDYAVNKLKMNNKSLSRGGENPLHYSVLSGNPQIDKALKLGIAWDSSAKDGSNILHYAILSRSVTALQTVRSLEVEKGSKLPTASPKGPYPLHSAAWTGNIDMVEQVLDLAKDRDRKIDINATNQKGENALMFALKKANQNQRVIKKLKEFGLSAKVNVAQDHQEEIRRPKFN